MQPSVCNREEVNHHTVHKKQTKGSHPSTYKYITIEPMCVCGGREGEREGEREGGREGRGCTVQTCKGDLKNNKRTKQEDKARGQYRPTLEPNFNNYYSTRNK